MPPFKRLSSSFRPRPLPRNQPHHHHLRRLLKFRLNRRWLRNLVQGQGTPQRSPPRAAAAGQLTMKDFFMRPRSNDEDDEDDSEPPTK